MSEQADATTELTADDPWPGLLAFSESNERYFKGRGQDIEDLAQLLRRDTLTVLTGQSGLGKTSLLQAGLFPLLRRTDQLPIYVRLDFAETSPDFVQQVRHHIAAESAAREVQAPAPDGALSLWEYFHRRGAAFWSRRNRLLTPVLVLDQFEELFTLVGSNRLLDARREQLFNALAELVCNRPPEALREVLNSEPARAESYDFERAGCCVLLSLREDFLPEFESRLRPLLGMPLRNHMRLMRLRGSEALKVVAEAGQAVVATGAAEPIVRFVAGGRAELRRPLAERQALDRLEVEPALLSLVCRELNHKRPAGGLITADLLEAEEENIVAGFYQRSLIDLDPGVKTFIEEQLLTSTGYRDTCAWDDALRLPGVSVDAIEALIKRRLLRKEERFGTLRVELTHDLLTPVIRRSRDERQADEARLEAEKQARQASEQFAVEQRARRRWRFASIAMALLSAGALFFAWRSDSAQRSAEALSRVVISQQLVARVRDLFAREPDLAWLVAQEAYRYPLPGPANQEARRLLLDSEYLVPQGLHRYLERKAGEPRSIRHLALSPDGRMFAGADVENRVLRWHAASGRLVAGQSEDHRGAVNAVAFSNDGRLIAAAGQNGSLRVLDSATGKRLGEPLVQHKGPVRGVAFGADGKVLFSAGEDGLVVRWERGPEPARRELLAQEASPVTQLVADGGGRRVAWSSDDRVMLWDDDSRRLAPALEATARVVGLALNRQGSLLAVATADGSLRTLETPTGPTASFRQVAHRSGVQVKSLDFSAEGRWLASGEANGSIRLWSGTNLQAGPVLVAPASGSEPLPATALRFGADGQTLVSAHPNGALIEWQPFRKPLPPRSLAESGTRFTLAAFSPKDASLATADDTEVVFWNATTGERQRAWKLDEPSFRIKAMAFHPRNGRLLVLAGLPEDQPRTGSEGRLWLVDPAGGPGKTLLLEPRPEALAVDSASGKIAVLSSPMSLEYFDADGNAIGGPGDTRDPAAWIGTIQSLGFAADGTLVAVGSYAVRVWKADKPFSAALTAPLGSGMALALLPDGRTLATRRWDAPGRIEFKEVATGKMIATETIRLAADSEPEAVAFSADGRWLALLTTRQRIILWDRQAGREAGEPFAAHGYGELREVKSLAFSPKGDQLIAVGGSVLLADTQRQSNEFDACAAAQRNMSMREWKDFMGEQPYRATCAGYVSERSSSPDVGAGGSRP